MTQVAQRFRAALSWSLSEITVTSQSDNDRKTQNAHKET